MTNRRSTVLMALSPDLRRLEMLRGAREPMDERTALHLRAAIVEAQEALGRLANAVEARPPQARR